MQLFCLQVYTAKAGIIHTENKGIRKEHGPIVSRTMSEALWEIRLLMVDAMLWRTFVVRSLWLQFVDPRTEQISEEWRMNPST